MSKIAVISTRQHISLSSAYLELRTIGRNIKLARKRRKWSEQELAKKAGIARSTLQSIEQGQPSVSIGSYYHVLQQMSLEGDLSLVGQTDLEGRRFIDEKLLNK